MVLSNGAFIIVIMMDTDIWTPVSNLIIVVCSDPTNPTLVLMLAVGDMVTESATDAAAGLER